MYQTKIIRLDGSRARPESTMTPRLWNAWGSVQDYATVAVWYDSGIDDRKCRVEISKALTRCDDDVDDGDDDDDDVDVDDDDDD